MKQLHLKDGRLLAYEEVGDLSGRAVFFFHGAPGSRLLKHPDASIAKRLGIRLITVDRPGYGYSDPQPNRTLLDWPKDVAELADQLGIARFVVAGASGGAVCAACCAHQLSERVTKAALVSCPAPFDRPGMKQSLPFGQRLQFTLAGKAPWLARWMGSSYATAVQKVTPAQTLQKLSGELPPAEVALIKQPGMIDLMIADGREAFRQGGEAFAHELGLMGAPWPFRPEEIRVPVHLWQGDQDTSVSLAMGEYLRRVIPGADCTLCPGEGHMVGLSHWEEILQWCAAE